MLQAIDNDDSLNPNPDEAPEDPTIPDPNGDTPRPREDDGIDDPEPQEPPIEDPDPVDPPVEEPPPGWELRTAMSDDQHPHEPFVPVPAHDSANGPKPGEGPDDSPDPETPSKSWDTDLEDTTAIDPEMPDPTETDR